MALPNPAWRRRRRLLTRQNQLRQQRRRLIRRSSMAFLLRRLVKHPRVRKVVCRVTTLRPTITKILPSCLKPFRRTDPSVLCRRLITIQRRITALKSKYFWRGYWIIQQSLPFLRVSEWFKFYSLNLGARNWLLNRWKNSDPCILCHPSFVLLSLENPRGATVVTIFLYTSSAVSQTSVYWMILCCLSRPNYTYRVTRPSYVDGTSRWLHLCWVETRQLRPGSRSVSANSKYKFRLVIRILEKTGFQQ